MPEDSQPHPVTGDETRKLRIPCPEPGTTRPAPPPERATPERGTGAERG